METEYLILKELQEIKDKLQSIRDVLKPKDKIYESITYYYEEGDKSTRPY